MAAYRSLLTQGLTAPGQRVVCRTAAVRLGRLAPRGSATAKWLGYVDQFVLFPLELLWEQRRWPADTRVLVSDQALGPWVPWIRRWPHLIVCHDLLALRASRGEFPLQPVGWSGRLYQTWIRWGFRQGKRFAAVSDASRGDLAQELPAGHAPIALLYNPLQEGFSPMPAVEARAQLAALKPGLGSNPFLLHVGSNWYKNRLGVCAVFAQLRARQPNLQLVLVGRVDQALRQWLAVRPDLRPAVWILTGVSQSDLRALYSQAAALLFPSYLEGFGWPVLEGLACGCPVITTDRPPLTEVGGEAAVYLPVAPAEDAALQDWVRGAAAVVDEVLERSAAEREHWRQAGLEQAARFRQAEWQEQLAALLP